MTAIVIDLPTARRRRNARPDSPPRRLRIRPPRRPRQLPPGPLRPGGRRGATSPTLDDEDEDDDWAQRAHRVIDAAEELLAAGRAADVVEFCGLSRPLPRPQRSRARRSTLALVGLTERLGDAPRSSVRPRLKGGGNSTSHIQNGE